MAQAVCSVRLLQSGRLDDLDFCYGVVRLGTRPPASAVAGLRTTPRVVLAASHRNWCKGSHVDSTTAVPIRAPPTMVSIPTTPVPAVTVPMSVFNPAASPTLPARPSIADSPAPTLNQASMFIGDGMGPLPSKVVTKIFIEMREPLLENGPDLYTEDQAKLYVFLGKEKAPLVANILTCTECFSAHSRSVLLNIQRSFPNSWHIIMYLIVKCHKCFEVLGWFNYDRPLGDRQDPLIGLRLILHCLPRLRWKSKEGSIL